ncbi:MFS transporter [Chitiniphilus purpureus]|uniref:MFS transporter n=1 Tax=Chitiniphilus purpureus TaxID=2981137 RepID=A0ABY6DNU5_9NEIS|nr:MFS transporter [Chitiniphilus sp. CD1]UXY16049.1 MFS transporter [Chitiniphilus sp. CD1]
MGTLKLPVALAVLRHRDFTRYLAARLIVALAMQMVNVAIGWQVYDLTGDMLDLGLVGLAQFAPFLVLILPAGQIADRYDRRRVLQVSFALQAATAVALWVFSIRGLSVVWPIFAVLVLAGCARALAMPAGQAIVMNLVPAADFGRATALSSSSFHAAVIAGPVLGGLLYLAGPQVVYGAATVLLITSVVLMLAVRPQQSGQRSPLSLSGVLEGFRFVRSRPVVLGAISLDLFAVLFGGVTALLPVFARDVLAVGPTGLGLLRTAPAVGAAFTSVLLAVRPITRHAGNWMFGGVALYGVATIVFGLSTNLALSVFALALTGAGDMVSVFVRHLLVQLETPDAIRGRVSAVNAVFIGASNELGEFESGLAAAWLGAVRATVLGGVVTLTVTGLWMRFFPPLARMDRFPEPVRVLPPDPAPGPAAR